MGRRTRALARPGPSLLAGPVAPASHWPRDPGMALEHWLALAGPPQAGGQTARTAASALCPLPSASYGLLACWPGLLAWSSCLGSGSRAPTPLLHPLFCTRRRTLTLTLLLSHSIGRSGLSFFLCCRPLSSLFFLLPTFLTRPRQSAPFPRETALSVPRVRMNLPHSWSVSSSLPYSPRLNLLVPRGASSPRPRVDSSNLSS